MDLIAALRFMPSLLCLEVDDDWCDLSPITVRLMSNLRCGGRNQFSGSAIRLIPKLRSLRLEYDGDTFDDQAFVENGRITLVARSGVDAEIYEPLRNLDGVGMRVFITGSNGTKI
ncbi:hypothetical protein J3R30DRAFT_3701206 [Lentinula aciculospora]|uniref:F-box domain-containing protein n=1 Tax=Lentinula aciculospora TaxID=153920 RepID=A0A9W9AD93_9AGAR|nr:hypothetical protein J3R30DRAFT_3701206 [Lentinula aciculospora]